MSNRGEKVVFHVNCPYCGEVVEAVCPEINATPRSVRAAKQQYELPMPLFAGFSTNHMSCTHCQKSFLVRWIF